MYVARINQREPGRRNRTTCVSKNNNIFYQTKHDVAFMTLQLVSLLTDTPANPHTTLPSLTTTSFIRTTLDEDRVGRKTYLRMTGSVASRIIIVAPRPGLDPLAPPSCDGPLLP